MIHYFKSKDKIKTDYYDKGYTKGRKIADHSCNLRLNRVVKQFKESIEEKENKIESLNKHVVEIEKALENFTHLFSRARFVSIKIEEESEIKLKKQTSEYQEVKNLAKELILLQRDYEKKLPKVEKKINDFKRENLQ